MSILLAVACREPASTEHFIAGAGPYVYEFDLSDAQAGYDFDLYTCLDGTPGELQALPGVLLRAEWRTPSDSLFVEKIYLPFSGSGRQAFSKQVYQPYRAGVVPAEPGRWTLTLRLDDRSQVLPIRGLGLVVRRVMPDRDRTSQMAGQAGHD